MYNLLTLFYVLSLTKIILTFFYHTFLFLARAAAQNPRDGVLQDEKIDRITPNLIVVVHKVAIKAVTKVSQKARKASNFV